jgi:hypothetical protein
MIVMDLWLIPAGKGVDRDLGKTAVHGMQVWHCTPFGVVRGLLGMFSDAVLTLASSTARSWFFLPDARILSATRCSIAVDAAPFQSVRHSSARAPPKQSKSCLRLLRLSFDID